MARPLLLIHGYSATGKDFGPLCDRLRTLGAPAFDLNVGNYISLNNEISIKDIAEGMDRAIRLTPELAAAEEFDAIVHSTGMLVVRSWLTNHPAAVGTNTRLKRLKHLIGVAPATWGSPQAHKGRTWLGALVKGDKRLGPDFLNAGDEVLDGLELGGRFTWDLAHLDLLGPDPYFGKGPDTPYVTVFIGNSPYSGISSVANDPGTDGTVRWAGCGLNTRKITLDLTHLPIGPDGKPTGRVMMTPWATDARLNVPMIAVDGKNHGTLISDPDEGMVQRIVSFLGVDSSDAYDAWLADATAYGAPALARMKVGPGNDASGIAEETLKLIGHLLDQAGKPLDGWQQFVVRARDERGDPVTDYMIEVYRRDDTGQWAKFDQMYTDVHAYAADTSFRCFYVQLPQGICSGKEPLQIHIGASSGTDVMAYQGYGSDESPTEMRADSDPVVLEIPGDLGGGDTLFHPFTTTLVEVILNREPYPFDAISKIFSFLPQG
jgi:pimeloyl-ACP methyl ester carboxylesterase